ncbi:MAG: hypothetical protein ACT4QA_00040 [Panacagrimonas sp.]
MLAAIFDRLVLAEPADAVFFGADEVATWPRGALEALTRAGFLQAAPPADVIVCDGCEQNCFMPVYVRPAEDDRAARAFVSCDKTEDLGRIRVELDRLRRWRLTSASLAAPMARLLGTLQQPQSDSAGRGWNLGLMKGSEHLGAVALTLEGGAELSIAGKCVPLVHVLSFFPDGLAADRGVLVRLAEGVASSPAAGVGSDAWRKNNARSAANARHDKPGGARDKKEQVREIWASGKYSDRDLCAEQECAALDMSFSAARKALRNTPEPKRG